MKEKILTLSLVAVALSIAPSSSTLAFLVDTVSSESVFTTGQVSIQNYTASIGRTINETTENTDTAIIENASSYETYLNTNCKEMFGGNGSNSTCEKHIFVKNTGKSDAFVRVRLLVPNNLISGDSPLIALNDANTNTASAEEYYYESHSQVTCGETTCVEYIYTYKNSLAAGAMTHYPAVDSITYLGIASVGTPGDNQGATSQSLDLTATNIKVYTEAIQAQGFENAQTAFQQFNYQY